MRDSKFGEEEHAIGYMVDDLKKAVKQVYGIAYDKLPVTVSEEMGNYLRRRPTNLPQPITEALAPMRAYMDSMSTRLVQSGAVGAPETMLTILGNRGQYLHRSYQAFDDKKWPDKVSEEVKQRAASYLWATTGWARNLENEQLIEGAINNMLQHGTAADRSVSSFLSESHLGTIDNSMLIQRKDIAKPIRDLLGEYKDVAVNFTRTATLLQRAVANSAFQKASVEDGLGTYFFERPTGKFSVPMTTDNSKNMPGFTVFRDGKAKTLYTTPEIKQAFADAIGQEAFSDFYRKVIAVNALVKYGKTVIAPTTMARNFVSAAFFSMAGGHLISLDVLKELKNSAKVLGGEITGKTWQREYYLKLKRMGVTLDNPYAGEMIGSIEDVMGQQQITNPIMRKVKETQEFFTKMYQFGDDFWKILGYEQEKKALIGAGFSDVVDGVDIENTSPAEREAANRIRNTYPTYSLVGKQIKRLRRFWAIGTFVSFPAEIVRTSVNIARLIKSDMQRPETRPIAYKRIAGTGIAAGWAYALSVMSMALMGIDDDDDEAVRKSGAPWTRNSNLVYTGKDKDGLWEYFDISYTDPYNYLKRPINAILTDGNLGDTLKSMAYDILGPFIGPDIAASAIGESIFNRKLDTGGTVYNPDSDPETQAMEIGAHIGKAVAPGAVGNMLRIWKASEGDTSPYGKKYDLGDEMVALAGFRKSTQNPKVGLRFTASKYKGQMQNANNILTREIAGLNKLSDSKLKSKFGEMMRNRQRVAERIIDQVKLSKNFLSDAEIVHVLTAMDVSRMDIPMLMNGMVPTWRFTNDYMANSRDVIIATSPASERMEHLRRLQSRIADVARLYQQYYE